MSEKINGNKQQDVQALQAYYEALRAKKQEKKVEEVKEQTAAKSQTKELGDKLLEKPYINMFTVKSNIAKEDEKDLQNLFALAGIEFKAPAKHVYERIGASVGTVEKVFRDIETERNIEELFASAKFKTLDDIFFS